MSDGSLATGGAGLNMTVVLTTKVFSARDDFHAAAVS
jgi:hypothetical protein